MTEQSSNPTPQRSALYKALDTLASKEQLIAALGLENPEAYADEFWVDQTRAVRSRFLCMCLVQLGMPPASDYGDFSADQKTALTIKAQQLLDNGLDYTAIRDWWHGIGLFLFQQCVDKRREDRRLASQCLRVLFILDKGNGAQWLAYDPNGGTPILVNNKEDAHEFLLLSLQELDKDRLAKSAELFSYQGKLFGAVQTKVLTGIRHGHEELTN